MYPRPQWNLIGPQSHFISEMFWLTVFVESCSVFSISENTKIIFVGVCHIMQSSCNYVRYILIGCLCQASGVAPPTVESQWSNVPIRIRFYVLIGCFCQDIQRFAFSKARKMTWLLKNVVIPNQGTFWNKIWLMSMLKIEL